MQQAHDCPGLWAQTPVPTGRGRSMPAHRERSHGRAAPGAGHRGAQDGLQPGVLVARLLATEFHEEQPVGRWVGDACALPVSSDGGTFWGTLTVSRPCPTGGATLTPLRVSSGSRQKEPPPHRHEGPDVDTLTLSVPLAKLQHQPQAQLARGHSPCPVPAPPTTLPTREGSRPDSEPLPDAQPNAIFPVWLECVCPARLGQPTQAGSQPDLHGLLEGAADPTSDPIHPCP